MSLAITNKCKNLQESYGYCCVLCNKCGRFNKKNEKDEGGENATAEGEKK